MPKREPKQLTYQWRTFNPVYGPWYRLTLTGGDTISGGEAVCMPDMDKSRWFWYVRIGPKGNPTKRVSGHERNVEDAKVAARAQFDALYRGGGA